MTVHEGADLHKRVERYEAAVDELRASHQDIKDVLTDQVLFERWQQIGAELGFSATQAQAPRDVSALNHQPEMSDAWS
ncbi:hypothetical protein AB0M20_24385 [Actinoplanes sp. NPDC051633]|jgi:hypothetical protein|uniref:hypothetical protein n=1 Tax=Actinoplanes sp. NPDC051633 TaxID=3155670 RepID=UPI003434378F